MGALFSKPSMPALPKTVIPAPAPVRDDAAVQGAAAAERQRVAALLGRGSTITGNPATYTRTPDARPTLLGVG